MSSPAYRRALSAMCGVLVVPVLIGTGCGPTVEEPPKTPDIVVVLIDTLRPDRLGLDDDLTANAPFLKRLARDSVVFRNAHSTSTWTAPATASLFTSLYPPQHGVVTGFNAHSQQIKKSGAAQIEINRLPRELETLPEVLRDNGYQTFGIATNINIGHEIGFDRGFDHFERLHDMSRASVDADGVHRELCQWKNQILEASPTFVYLHFNDVHRPYHRREPWYPLNGSALAAYDSEISYLDRTLESLFAEFGWDEDAIVVLVSDHGEEFGEHGGIGHGPTLYGELLNILMFIKAPDLEPASVDTNVSIIDLMPTILELANLDPVPGRQGVSLVPLLTGSARRESDLAQRALFAHRGSGPGQDLWAVLHQGRKLIQQGDTFQLFDTIHDPLDQQNVVLTELEAAKNLKAILDEYRQNSFMRGESTQIELDADEIEVLRSLGYVN